MTLTAYQIIEERTELALQMPPEFADFLNKQTGDEYTVRYPKIGDIQHHELNIASDARRFILTLAFDQFSSDPDEVDTEVEALRDKMFQFIGRVTMVYDIGLFVPLKFRFREEEDVDDQD